MSESASAHAVMQHVDGSTSMDLAILLGETITENEDQFNQADVLGASIILVRSCMVNILNMSGSQAEVYRQNLDTCCFFLDTVKRDLLERPVPGAASEPPAAM